MHIPTRKQTEAETYGEKTCLYAHMNILFIYKLQATFIFVWSHTHILYIIKFSLYSKRWFNYFILSFIFLNNLPKFVQIFLFLQPKKMPGEKFSALFHGL